MKLHVKISENAAAIYRNECEKLNRVVDPVIRNYLTDAADMWAVLEVSECKENSAAVKTQETVLHLPLSVLSDMAVHEGNINDGLKEMNHGKGCHGTGYRLLIVNQKRATYL